MNDTVKGKYRIVREIARSNDIVYEAMDTTLQRRLALKELNIAPGMTGQAKRERVERFGREARAAGKLSHANIVHVYDHWEENGRYFIAMEYLEGQTLRDLMQMRGALSLKEAVDIACQTLDALAHAHQNKVIHRDIKPDNIFILPGGAVKLTDFGIARLSEEPALTSNGQVFGTPSYMSPEQIEGKHIDNRSDLFSLGVLLYEMLAGRKPFTGDSVISITYAIMNAEPQPLAGVPAGVEQVIRRALSKRPENRQISADQMRQDLRSAEQTPAVFLPSQNSGVYLRRTNLPGGNGYAGNGYGGSGTNAPDPYGNAAMQGGMANGYPGQNAGYGQAGAIANPNYNPSYPPTKSQQSPPAGNADPNGLPWAWNQPGAGQTGAQTRAQRRQQTRQAVSQGLTAQQIAAMTPQQAAQYAQSMQGGAAVYPFAAPPYQARPRQPLIVLSPGARSILYSLVAAVGIGCALAFGIVAFMNRYQAYQVTASSAQVKSLMTQGKTAYESQNYAQAAQFFEQGLAAHPDATDRDYLQKNLAYTYTQLARQAKAQGSVQNALAYYEKATQYAPDYKVAHEELSVLKESMQDVSGARAEREAAQGSRISQPPPASLELPPLSRGGSAPMPSNADPNQFTQSKSDQAKQMLADGDQMLRNNDLSGALRKWREARDTAPGLPEFDQAQARISQYDPTGSQ